MSGKRDYKGDEHHFKIDDAIKYGVEKAAIIYNFRFWLNKNRANRVNVEELKGKKYFWTYNSARALAELLPYLSEDTIQRHLKGLEEENILISGTFNKKNYDRTKWYTMPEYETPDSAILRNGVRESAEPIPDNKLHILNIPLAAEITMKEYQEPIVNNETGKVDNLEKSTVASSYKELLSWGENQRGQKFFKNTVVKQYTAMKILRENGISISEIKKRWKEMQGEDFYKKVGIDFMMVVSSINKKR